jgi:hypothetical protein
MDIFPPLSPDTVRSDRLCATAMQTRPFMTAIALLVSALLSAYQCPHLSAQDNTALTNPFNECGAPDQQGRYFLTRDARMAMGPLYRSAQKDESYKETLFFGSPLDGGARFVSRVLRAGHLSNGSERVLATKTLSSAAGLRDLLSELSSSNPTPNQHGQLPTVVHEINVGTPAHSWPDSARNGRRSWYEPHRMGGDDTTYEIPLRVAIVYDEDCTTPISAGIVRFLDMSSVRDDAPALAKLFSPPPSMSIWIDGLVSIDLSARELERCDVFTLSHPKLGGSKERIASALADRIQEMVGYNGEVNTRDSTIRQIFADRDQFERACLGDFDYYLEWAAAAIGPELREQAIAEAIEQLQYIEERSFKEDRRYPHWATARDKYLQILRSAQSPDVAIAPEPNGTPDGDPATMEANTESQDGAARSEIAKNLVKEIVEANVEKATNSREVKNWVDARIASSIRKNPRIPESQKPILTTIEQSLEQDSKLITGGAIVGKSLLVGLDVFTKPSENEKALEEIRELARRGDPYGAWKKTITGSLDMASDALPGRASPVASVMSSAVGEVLADATVDIFVPLGNRIAWWNGYSPRPPRFAKDQFANGVSRTGYFNSLNGGASGPLPRPTVPAAPNGAPTPLGPNTGNDPGEVPAVVPPIPGPQPPARRPNADVDVPDSRPVPFVPIVTPVPTPPPLYNQAP